VRGQATTTASSSIVQPSTGQSQASASNNDSNSSDSNKQEQSEGAISGLSNLKRKLAEIDKEKELYKIEQTKMEDEISTVTNSLSRLRDGHMRAELAGMKNILLGMSNNKATSQRRKNHRRTKNIEATSSSSKNEEMATSAGVSPMEYELTWESICESEAEHNILPPTAMVTLSTLEDLDLNGVDTGSRVLAGLRAGK
jgi:hypothetical protein